MAELFYGYCMPEAKQSRIHLPKSVRDRFETLQAMLDETCVSDPEVLARSSEALKGLADVYRNIVYFKEIDRVELGQIWRWTVRLLLRSYSHDYRLQSSHICSIG